MKPSLPVLLSVNGGFVDTAGFLALQGLFTSHVTGNFVTLGAALVLGTSGVLAAAGPADVLCRGTHDAPAQQRAAGRTLAGAAHAAGRQAAAADRRRLPRDPVGSVP